MKIVVTKSFAPWSQLVLTATGGVILCLVCLYVIRFMDPVVFSRIPLWVIVLYLAFGATVGFGVFYVFGIPVRRRIRTSSVRRLESLLAQNNFELAEGPEGELIYRHVKQEGRTHFCQFLNTVVIGRASGDGVPVYMPLFFSLRNWSRFELEETP